MPKASPSPRHSPLTPAIPGGLPTDARELNAIAYDSMTFVELTSLANDSMTFIDLTTMPYDSTTLIS